MLPQDPIILLSYINTQLRDNYSSLEALADGLELDENALSEVVQKLEGVGYKYDSGVNQFK
jgi:biotin operon repressor